MLSVPLAIALVARPTRAQSSGENANVAEALFREAVRLYDAKRTHEACEKFAESFRLDPANGTLQDLALCHETEWKIASAWAEYTQLVARAAQAKQDKRAELARARATTLAPRVSRVRLAFGASSNVARVAIDGHEIGRAAWPLALPVDAGEHTVSFSAPGFAPATAMVRVVREGETLRVDVPALEPAPPPTALPTASAPPADAQHEPPTPSSRRSTGWIVGGAGLVAVAIGGYFGLRAMSEKSDGDARCNGRFCDATGLALEDDAHTHAAMSTVAFATGLAAIAGGAYLILSSKDGGASVGVAPQAGARGAQVRAEVRF